MWARIAGNLAKHLATTENGHKILKSLLVVIVGLFIVVPVVLFMPIAGLVNGLTNFYSGEEGEDLNDDSDIDALLSGTFDLTQAKYYKQIDKARTKHIESIKKEQEARAAEVREENSYTITTTDSEGNEEEETVYPEVATPEPNPPIISVLAYFCTTKEVQMADKKSKISVSVVKAFYEKICKRPFTVTSTDRDHYTVSIEYLSDQEIAELLRSEGLLADDADVDLFQVSIERFAEMLKDSIGYAYDGTPSGNISDTGVARQIWNYFKSQGWSDYACAALIGNFEAECSLKPNLQETGGTGIGLGQWSYGRRTKFLNWLKSTGKNITDIVAQCEYIIHENVWYGGTKTLYNSGGLKHSSKANSLSEFGKFNYERLSDAVDDWCWHWESPNYQKAHMDRRQGAAQDAYNMFAGGGNASGATGGGSYAQIKKSYFPNGLPTSDAEMKAKGYLVTIQFLNSKGVAKKVTVHKSVAADLLTALTTISKEGYEIRDISGYVWKNKTNSSSGSLSSHSYGLAIDINPNYGNPQVKNGKVLVGTPYGSHELSMKEGGVAVKTLKSYGWKWGGNWTSSKDYMHFSIPGD